MVLANVSGAKLALNEACEQKYALSAHVMQPMSSLWIALAVAYASFSLVQICRLEARRTFRNVLTSFPVHAVLAQLLYHCTHLHIHHSVDMAHVEVRDFYNPFLVFHFAHQAGTLGAFYFRSCSKGFLPPFCLVVGAYLATGMIYPTIWTYLPLVAWFRSKLGKAAASSFLTLLLTGMEVKLCDVGIRSGERAFPFHALADLGQLSVLIQCSELRWAPGATKDDAA